MTTNVLRVILLVARLAPVLVVLRVVHAAHPVVVAVGRAMGAGAAVAGVAAGAVVELRFR